MTRAVTSAGSNLPRTPSNASRRAATSSGSTTGCARRRRQRQRVSSRDCSGRGSSAAACAEVTSALLPEVPARLLLDVGRTACFAAGAARFSGGPLRGADTGAVTDEQLSGRVARVLVEGRAGLREQCLAAALAATQGLGLRGCCGSPPTRNPYRPHRALGRDESMASPQALVSDPWQTRHLIPYDPVAIPPQMHSSVTLAKGNSWVRVLHSGIAPACSPSP